jgi:protein TonB
MTRKNVSKRSASIITLSLLVLVTRLYSFSSVHSDKRTRPPAADTPSVDTSRVTTLNIEDTTSEPIFDYAQKQPEFIGGEEAFTKYLSDNIRYPHYGYTTNNWTIYVSFVVNKNGSITNVNVAKKGNPLLDAEIIRVIAQMPPWEPGKLNGEAVAVRMIIPIRLEPSRGCK